MKKTFLFLSLLFAVGLVFAQTPFTATYTFGADGNVQSFAYNGTTYPGITMSNVDKVGVTTSLSASNFRATTWPTVSSPDTGKYIGFTITAASGYKFTVNTINFGIGRSGTGTRDTEWRGSADSYGALINNYTTLNSNLTNNSGVLNNPDTNSNWTGNVLTLGSSYAEVTTSCGFRVYLYTAEASGGTAGLAGPLTVTGTITQTGGGSPSIIVNPNTLSDFSYVYGNGPSDEQSFSVTGSNLTANVSVSVTSNYAISSTSGGTFGSSLTLTQSGGSVSATVYVQQVAGLAIGTGYTGTVTCSSTGAADATVSLSGEVTTPPAPDEPVADEATGVSDSGFTANWDAVTGATGYEIDVYYMTQGTTAQDLIISEYIEGSSSNKYIEIYNGTGNAVDLSNYKLQLYSNGASAVSYEFTLSGTLAHGEAIVYKNGAAALTLPSGVTAIDNSSVINFNGDDAVALYYDDGTKAAYYVDIFGVIGDDPGSAWTGDGDYTTVNKTLVRKSSVTGGITTNPSGTGSTAFTTLTIEWDMYDQDTATYLGSHTMAGGSTLVYVSGYEDYDAGNVTSLSITGLDPNTTYYYVVRAYNDYGTSGNSNEQEVLTDEEPLPVELASFTATISAQNYITLTWVTQTETGMRGYYIYRDTDNNFAGAQNVSPLIPSANSSQMQTYVFEDTDVFETGTYYYWLQANDMDGTVGFHGPVSVFYNATGDNPTPEIPLVTELKSVYPNPFNPLAFIPFSLAQDSNVSFKIYNARGQIVKHYELGNKAAGNYRITWDGTDYHGDTLSNGVYQIVMTAGSQVYQTKTTLLK